MPANHFSDRIGHLHSFWLSTSNGFGEFSLLRRFNPDRQRLFWAATHHGLEVLLLMLVATDVMIHLATTRTAATPVMTSF